MNKWIEKSVNVIKENQRATGAFISSTSPPEYAYCYLRDASFCAYAFDLLDHKVQAAAYFNWSNKIFIKNGNKIKKAITRKNNGEQLIYSDYLLAVYLDNGKERRNWYANSLDGYATWLWAVIKHIQISGESVDLYLKGMTLIANYLKVFWKYPCSDCWEDKEDYIHTSTLSTIYGAFAAFSKLVQDAAYLEAAQEIKTFILNHCVFDGRLSKFADYDSIDSSLLYACVPFDLFKADDPIMKKTVVEIETQLLKQCGLRRYPKDVYYGGGSWLVLSCLLAWYYNELGNKVRATEIIDWVEAQANENGELPEQVHVHLIDPEYLERFEEVFGKSACPLLWAHAMYLIVTYEIVKEA